MQAFGYKVAPAIYAQTEHMALLDSEGKHKPMVEAGVATAKARGIRYLCLQTALLAGHFLGKKGLALESRVHGQV